MKKTTLIAFAFGVSSAFAQDLTSKKGEPILPEAGDWAIGFDASPVMLFVGNAFNGNMGNASPAAKFTNTNLAITGKMFKDATTAYRAKVRIGFGSMSTSTKVAAIPATTPATFVDDKTTVSDNNITLGGGLEMRKGKTRLQGFYGGEALLMLGGSKTTTKYGNALAAANPVTRTTETKMGSTFGFTARGFIGVEYFVLPKISLGAEFGWGLGFESKGEGSSTTESWDVVANAPVVTTAATGKSSTFKVDTDNSGGAVTIMFHF